MNIRYLFVTLTLLLVASPALPQRRSGVPGAKGGATSAAQQTPPYVVILKIADGSKLSVSIASESSNSEIGPLELNSFITDLPGGADKFNAPNKVAPKIIVQPSPNISMLDFWNPITLFRLDRTDVRVIIPGVDHISIPRLPKADPIEVKPNPLLLMVTIDDNGELSLNNETYGTLSDTKALREKLQNIFKDRASNGVFREGTNSIEAAVSIVMPMSERKFSDVITIADALRKAGATPIFLEMGSNGTDDRKELIIDVFSAPTKAAPIVPRKKKPSK